MWGVNSNLHYQAGSNNAVLGIDNDLTTTATVDPVTGVGIYYYSIDLSPTRSFTHVKFWDRVDLPNRMGGTLFHKTNGASYENQATCANKLAGVAGFQTVACNLVSVHRFFMRLANGNVMGFNEIQLVSRKCIDCPLNSTSAIDGSGNSICVCKSGFWGPSAGPCCIAGFVHA